MIEGLDDARVAHADALHRLGSLRRSRSRHRARDRHRIGSPGRSHSRRARRGTPRRVAEGARRHNYARRSRDCARFSTCSTTRRGTDRARCRIAPSPRPSSGSGSTCTCTTTTYAPRSGIEPQRGDVLTLAVAALATSLTRRGWGPATLALDDTPPFDIGAGGREITGDPYQFVLVASGRADPATLGLDETVNIYRAE